MDTSRLSLRGIFFRTWFWLNGSSISIASYYTRMFVFFMFYLGISSTLNGIQSNQLQTICLKLNFLKHY